MTLKLSQYSKSGSTLSKLVEAHIDSSLQGSSLRWCLPVKPAQDVSERCPKSSVIDFAVNTFDCLSGIAFGSDCQMTGEGLELGIKFELCSLTNELYSEIPK